MTSDLPHETIRILINHLRHSHEHFSYEACQDQVGNLHVVMRRDREADYDATTLYREMRTPYFYYSIGRPKTGLYNFAIPRVKVMSVEPSSSNGAWTSTSSTAVVTSNGDNIVNSIHEEPYIPLPKRWAYIYTFFCPPIISSSYQHDTSL